MQEEHSVAESRVESTKDDLPTFRGIGEVLGTYLGIPAILLYPMGLCVLAWQLGNDFDLKFLTSWYAASLVPTAVVAGLGVEVLLLPFFVSVLLATLISLAFAKEFASEFARREQTAKILRGVRLSHHRESLRIGVFKALRVAIGVMRSARSKKLKTYVVVLLALMFLIFGVLLVVLAAKAFGFLRGFVFLAPAILVSGAGGLIVAHDYGKSTHRDKVRPGIAAFASGSWLYRGVQDRWIFRGLAVAYMGGLLAAASAAYTEPPNLPRVIMCQENEGKVDGLLLSHTDGYWHLVNYPPLHARPDSSSAEIEEDRLLIIPKENAHDVRVLEEPGVADLSLSMADKPRWDGYTLSYALLVKNDGENSLPVINDGDDLATDVTLTDTLPEDATLGRLTEIPSEQGAPLKQGERRDLFSAAQRQESCGGGKGSFVVNLGTLDEGEERVVEIEVKTRPTAERRLVNVATVSGTQTDFYERNNTSTQKAKTKTRTNAPVTQGTVSPEPNRQGWSDDDVTVSLKAEDDSGVKKIIYEAYGSHSIAKTTVLGDSAQVPITTEGETTIVYWGVDSENNLERPKKQRIVRVDKTAPEIKCGSADAQWHKRNARVPCTTADSGSGLANASDGSFYLRTYVDDGEEEDDAPTGARQVLDVAGNSKTVGPIGGNKVDKKAPGYSCPADDGIWHNNNASFTCSASDDSSGLTPATDADFTLSTSVGAGAQKSSASTGSKLLSDAVGNTVKAGPITGIKVDRKAPDVKCHSANREWHASDVSIACSASDGGSSLANHGDASFKLSTNVATGTETSNASTETYDVYDAAGNKTTAGPIGENKVDKKAPDIAVTQPADGARYRLRQHVEATYTCADEGSGVKSCAGSVARGRSVNTAAKGSKEFIVSAEDKVGNRSSVTRDYSVTHTRDDTLPETIIDFGPSRTETSASATLTFSSTESGSSFQCKLDDRAFRTCVSPKSYSGLDNGFHTFEVRAIDGAGNEDPTPSSRTWVVNLGERRHPCELPDTGGNTASSDVPTMPRRARAAARNRRPLRLTTF